MERIIFEQSPLVFNQSNAWNLKFVYLLLETTKIELVVLIVYTELV